MHRKYFLREISRQDWNHFWPQVRHANLLQSWEYGEAKAQAEGWRPIRFLIEDERGTPVALTQILSRSLPFIGGIARLNRGPLFLDVMVDAREALENVLGSLAAVLSEKRRRRWWLLYVAPELEADDKVSDILGEIGLTPRNSVPWASARLSLAPSTEALMAGLDGKWRNMLRKALKSGLSVQCEEGSSINMEPLIARYNQLKQDRSFEGVSEDLIRSLARQCGPHWRFQCYYLPMSDPKSALADNCSGIVVCVIHGDTATYLIGCTDDFGRKLNANYLLLWYSILAAKKAGCSWFDLGGLNNNTPLGVVHFKQGMRGTPYSLAGEFKASIFSRNRRGSKFPQ